MRANSTAKLGFVLSIFTLVLLLVAPTAGAGEDPPEAQPCDSGFTMIYTDVGGTCMPDGYGTDGGEDSGRGEDERGEDSRSGTDGRGTDGYVPGLDNGSDDGNGPGGPLPCPPTGYEVERSDGIIEERPPEPCIPVDCDRVRAASADNSAPWVVDPCLPVHCDQVVRAVSNDSSTEWDVDGCVPIRCDLSIPTTTLAPEAGWRDPCRPMTCEVWLALDAYSAPGRLDPCTPVCGPTAYTVTYTADAMNDPCPVPCETNGDGHEYVEAMGDRCPAPRCGRNYHGVASLSEPCVPVNCEDWRTSVSTDRLSESCEVVACLPSCLPDAGTDDVGFRLELDGDVPAANNDRQRAPADTTAGTNETPRISLVAPVSQTVAPAQAALPQTGSNSFHLSQLALLLVAVGGMFVLVGRRRSGLLR